MSGNTVAAVERALAAGPYGDSSSLRANSDALYAGVTDLFTEVFDEVELQWPWPPTAQARILIRGAFDHVMPRLSADPEQARNHVAAVLALIAEAGAEPQDPISNGPTPVALRHLRGTLLGEEIQSGFHATMRSDGHAFEIEPLVPDGREQAAMELLAELLPVIGPSTMSFVSGLGVFTGERLTSAYAAATPGLVYVSESLLGDRLETADAILHECLHQKLAEIELTRRVLRNGYRDEDAHHIVIPWGGPGRTFSVDRSLGAFHVYVHGALLHLAAVDRSRPDIDADDLDARLGIRWSRAAFFASALATAESQAELGPDGRRLVRWLTKLNDQLGRCGDLSGRTLSSARGGLG
ncbi:aKG-HExxH-type peptide beta-hydroxylase [Actinacidiphila glaucinigra]|uniref:aKG-HExxH-type peptide beta-hydroxylase n=1 Tax=Actinacidiphila glaucinigra TaxID=235986 RepID=UPI00379A660E